MLADHIVAAIAHQIEEVLVGTHYLTLEVELDHRHGAVDGLDVALVHMFGRYLAGDVGGDLHYLGHRALIIPDWHVGRFQPDLLAVLRQPWKAIAEVLALAQALPELLIGEALAQVAGAEQTMLLADDLFQAVIHYTEKGWVGVEDDAVRGELDHRHRLANGL